MFANYLIGLREGLEAALVVSILVAYLVKTDRRHLLPADLAGRGARGRAQPGLRSRAHLRPPRPFTFEAQELIGGASRSSRSLRDLDDLLDGPRRPQPRAASCAARSTWPPRATAGRWSWSPFLAVGREGLETALFLWAATKAGIRESVGTVTPTWEPLLGAALGIPTAVVLGYLIYRGAISINLTKFFTWTGAFLILVAAGVLAYGVHDLQEAGFLPGLNNLAFDVSDTIDPNSWYGTLLKGIFNFCPATTKLEAAAWLLYVVPVMTLFLITVRRRSSPAQDAPAPPASPVRSR